MYPPTDHIAIGPFSIKLYGIIAAVLVLLCFWLTRRRSLLYNIPPVWIDDLVPFLIIFGIIGARLYHVIDKFSYYRLHPLEILAIWHGGIGIFGALFAGFVVLFFYAHRRRLSILSLLDLLAPAVLLGQGIGRWGNFFNQEAFGRPTALPIHVTIDVWHRPLQWLGYSWYQPLFLYEFMWDFVGALLLFYVARRLRSRQGFLFALYCIIFGLGRLVMEQFRFDTAMLGSIKLASILSLGLILLGIAIIALSFARQNQTHDVE